MAYDGMPIPRPPSLAGRANNVHTRSLGGGLIVQAGRRSERRASSSGTEKKFGLQCTTLEYVASIAWVKSVWIPHVNTGVLIGTNKGGVSSLLERLPRSQFGRGLGDGDELCGHEMEMRYWGVLGTL